MAEEESQDLLVVLILVTVRIMDFILHVVSIMVLEDQPTVEHADHFINFLELVPAGETQLQLAALREVGRCTEDMDMAEVVVLLEDQLQAIGEQDGAVFIVITEDIKLE